MPKHIIKIVTVNGDGSYEALIEVPELGRRYESNFDHKHRFLGSKELVSGTIIPEETPIEGPLNYPISVGNKWKYLNTKGKHLASGIYYIYNNYYEVISYEKITIEAGEIWRLKYIG